LNIPTTKGDTVKKLTTILTTILVMLATFTGASAQASQPVSQPVSQPATFDSYYLHSAAQWGAETLAQAGIKVPANVHITYTNDNNCGAQETGRGGCTTHNADGTITVAVSPALKYSAWGNHILFHEYAHTLGYGECGAEAYAHVLEGNADLWSYPTCEEL
jgi:hypothetical protein